MTSYGGGVPPNEPPQGWQQPQQGQPPEGWQGPSQQGWQGQPPQQGWQGQPPPAKKKKFYTRWWFFVLLAVVVIVAIATSGGSDDDSDTASPAPSSESVGSDSAAEPAPEETEAEPPPAAAGIGTPVRDGQFEFVVNSVECGVPQIGSADFGVTAQGQFCLVNLSVTNVGDEPQSFFGDAQRLFNEAGQEYGASAEAAIYLPEANSLFQEINPGNQLVGVVVFDIPADAVPFRIELHDSAFSGGVEVALQ